MKKAEAALKFCPLIRDTCMTDTCIAWAKTKISNASSSAAHLIQEIIDLTNNGLKIEAIKKLRSELNMSLKDAKDAVELDLYPDLIRKFFNASESNDEHEERGYCVRFSNTLGNESPIY
jgi:ribosomal protein L7/L12